MLKLVHYSDDILLEQYIKNSSNDGSKFLLITPDPATADSLRRKFSEIHDHLDVVTIAKFKTDLSKAWLNNEEARKQKTKSELMWILATFFLESGVDLSFAQFSRAFEMLTELRSFSTDSTIISEILASEDQTLARLIIAANNYLEKAHILDEHAIYFEFKYLLRSTETKLEKITNIGFMGFKNLSPIQLDFIEAFGIRHEVSVFVPMPLLEIATNTDWLGWLKNKVEIITLGSKKEEVINAFKIETQKGQNNLKLNSLLKDFKGEICLAGKNISIEYFQEIPTLDFNLKQSIDIFSNEIANLSDDFKKLLGSRGELDRKVLIEHLVQTQKDLLTKKDLKFLRRLKILQESISILSSSELKTINQLMLTIMVEMLKLDVPRLSMIRMLKTQSQISVLTLKNLKESDISKDLITILDSKYGDAMSSEKIMGKEMEIKLIALGPLKSAKLENEFLKQNILSVINRKKSIFLIPKDYLKTNMFWANILRDVNFSDYPIETKVIYPAKQILNEKATVDKKFKLSASSFQNYLDCPKKFYYQNIQKKNLDYLNPLDATPSELGILEHGIIQEYFEKIQNNELVDLNKLIADKLHILYNLKNVDEFNQEKNEIELKQSVNNGIMFLHKLKEILPLEPYTFEQVFKEVAPYFKEARIDCLSVTENLVVLLDFKRSTTSVPTLTEIKNMDKIQLWFYLNVLKSQGLLDGDKKFLAGFICLNDPESSRLFSNVSMPTIQINEKNLKVTELTNLDQYIEFEKNKIEELFVKNDFSAAPRNKKVCHYCFLDPICSKGLNHVQS
jgi:sulfur carrier protein ThiS